MIIKDETLPEYLRLAIIDRYEGWELVALLDIDVRDVIDNFEDVILDNLNDIREELGEQDEDEED